MLEKIQAYRHPFPPPAKEMLEALLSKSEYHALHLQYEGSFYSLSTYFSPAIRNECEEAPPSPVIINGDFSQVGKSGVQLPEGAFLRALEGLTGEKNLFPLLSQGAAVIFLAPRIGSCTVEIGDAELKGAVNDVLCFFETAVGPQDTLAAEAHLGDLEPCTAERAGGNERILQAFSIIHTERVQEKMAILLHTGCSGYDKAAQAQGLLEGFWQGTLELMVYIEGIEGDTGQPLQQGARGLRSLSRRHWLQVTTGGIADEAMVRITL